MAGRVLDTTVEAALLQETAHAALGPEGRVRIAIGLSEAVRQIRMAGLQSEHPHASRSELVRRFVHEAYGVRLRG